MNCIFLHFREFCYFSKIFKISRNSRKSRKWNRNLRNVGKCSSLARYAYFHLSLKEGHALVSNILLHAKCPWALKSWGQPQDSIRYPFFGLSAWFASYQPSCQVSFNPVVGWVIQPSWNLSNQADKLGVKESWTPMFNTRYILDDEPYRLTACPFSERWLVVTISCVVSIQGQVTSLW